MDINGFNEEHKNREKSEDVPFKKIKSVDVIFTLEDKFKGNEAEEGRKYVIAIPIKVGISGENYYQVQTGVEKGKMIVTGGYKALSKLLNHGDLVKIRD